MESLADKVQLAKDGDENAMLYIINLFEPLIGTYTALLNYDNKDSRSDLIEKLIKVVKVRINLKNMHSNSNGAVFNYIRSSLKRQYILLSKASQEIRDHETLYDQETLIEMAEKGSEYAPDSTDDSIVIDLMKSVLTEREFMYIKLIVIDGYTAEAISGHFGISKQAVNQCKNRGLEKLKKIYILSD